MKDVTVSLLGEIHSIEGGEAMGCFRGVGERGAGEFVGNGSGKWYISRMEVTAVGRVSALLTGMIGGILCVASNFVFDQQISVISAFLTIAICCALTYIINNNRSREVYLVNEGFFVAYTRDKMLHVFPRNEIDTVGFECEGEDMVLYIRSKGTSVRLDASISGRESILQELRRPQSPA